MKVAIPYFQDEIAPCFDVATHFVIYQVEGEGNIIHKSLLVTKSGKAMENIRRLQEVCIDVLICGGISKKYRYLLEISGIEVVSRITGPAQVALKAFLAGELSGPNEEPIFQCMDENPSLADLINISIQLFSRMGFRIFYGDEYAHFPIDFIAEMTCPICGKAIKVAVCCGKHVFRIDEEIREFHFNAGEAFNAKVYVQFYSPAVEKTCLDLGIQLLDINQQMSISKNHSEFASIPLIKLPVQGHDKCL